jgi:hypothetical protein
MSQLDPFDFSLLLMRFDFDEIHPVMPAKSRHREKELNPLDSGFRWHDEGLPVESLENLVL